MRVGIFDSGIGGINVLSCLIKKYPNNEYIYFGDTKNLPYGNKSKEELLNLASLAIEFLLSKNVDLIIIACGTISSNCYTELKNKYSIPIYDIISPTIEYLKNGNFNKIGVIGTNKTIESGIFDIPNKSVLMKATPNLVPIIENNKVLESKEEITNELSCFNDYDVLVLGCTHYPIIRGLISIKTVDMGEVLADSISLSNNSKYSCELYFSLVSVNLITNINNILKTDYQIYLK